MGRNWWRRRPFLQNNAQREGSQWGLVLTSWLMGCSHPCDSRCRNTRVGGATHSRGRIPGPRPGTARHQGSHTPHGRGTREGALCGGLPGSIPLQRGGKETRETVVTHFMQIQVNTDNVIEGREALSAHIRSVVEHALNHESTHITRVEVHLADENGPTKGGLKQIRCTMEARLEQKQPAAVSCDAATVHQAVEGAAEKLAHLVEHTLGKLRHERKHRTDPMTPDAAAAGRP